MGDRRIAAFDFDGTITTRDTLLPFLARTCGRRTFARALRSAGLVAARSRVGSRLHPADSHHRDASKTVLLRELLTGRSAVWLAERGDAYAREVLPTVIRPEMIDQIGWHRDNGHELVLVSASLDAYLRPFGTAQGFDEIIAVTLEVDDTDTLTGELARPNVRGPEKAVRLREWLAGDEATFMWGYGNSSGDRELLALADQPVWVGRRRPTSRTAPQPGAASVLRPTTTAQPDGSP